MVLATLELVLNRFIYHRLAIIGVVAAACLLSACGRKGPLDPPPGGLALDSGTIRTPVTSRAGAALPTEYDEEGKPVAPAGQKRKIPADWLID
jgi:predicted small lipoprotein YifL